MLFLSRLARLCVLDKNLSHNSKFAFLSLNSFSALSLNLYGNILRSSCPQYLPLFSLPNCFSSKIHSFPIGRFYSPQIFDNADSVWGMLWITSAKKGIELLQKEYKVDFGKQEVCHLNYLLRFWQVSHPYLSLHLWQVIRKGICGSSQDHRLNQAGQYIYVIYQQKYSVHYNTTY